MRGPYIPSRLNAALSGFQFRRALVELLREFQKPSCDIPICGMTGEPTAAHGLFPEASGPFPCLIGVLAHTSANAPVGIIIPQVLGSESMAGMRKQTAPLASIDQRHLLPLLKSSPVSRGPGPPAPLSANHAVKARGRPAIRLTERQSGVRDQQIGHNDQAGCQRPVHVSGGVGSGSWPFPAKRTAGVPAWCPGAGGVVSLASAVLPASGIASILRAVDPMAGISAKKCTGTD